MIIKIYFLRSTKVAGLLVMFSLLSPGCKKLIEVDPPETSLTSNNVFTTDATAIAGVTAAYAKMSSIDADYGTNSTFSNTGLYQGLKADELFLISESLQYESYYKNELTPQYNNGTASSWTGYYASIYTTNLLLEGLAASSTISAAVKQHLLGEVHFLRAFIYFYLVNLYGDVPLALTSDYKINTGLTRSAVSDVYAQIIADLKDAENLLPDNYVGPDIVTPDVERIRPNKFTASALLARVYLYNNRYAEAEAKASEVISSNLYDVTSVALNDVFKKNSRETIWAIQPSPNAPKNNTGEGRTYIILATGPDVTSNYALSDTLWHAFETGDQRKTEWIGSITSPANIIYHYPFKYKIGRDINPTTEEYIMVMRLAEQYLIRAEARAQQGKLSEAADDVNLIRARAGLPDISPGDQLSLLTAIVHERQTELFTEWGHRWFDLRRLQKLDEVMPGITEIKGGDWQPFKALEPIPSEEINASPGLIGHQNPGYN